MKMMSHTVQRIWQSIKTAWVLILLVQLSGCKTGMPERSPNFIIILTDDQGYGDLGYDTACIGKWHLGLPKKESPAGWDPSTMPNGQGFDYFLGTPLYNGFTVYVDDTP